MSKNLPTYAPPNLNKERLEVELLTQYPSHKGNERLLCELVEEYVRLWRLVLSYPERRVVAPGPIMAVQQIHWYYSREQYFKDCMDYFNKFIPPILLAWKGVTDHLGVHDTVTVYHDLYKADPPRAWADMTSLYAIRKNNLRLV